MSDADWNGTTDTTCLADWSQAYLDHARSMFAEKTYKEKRSMFRNFFKHIEPTLPVSELKAAMVMDYLLKQKESGAYWFKVTVALSTTPSISERAKGFSMNE